MYKARTVSDLTRAETIENVHCAHRVSGSKSGYWVATCVTLAVRTKNVFIFRAVEPLGGRRILSGEIYEKHVYFLANYTLVTMYFRLESWKHLLDNNVILIQLYIWWSMIRSWRTRFGTGSILSFLFPVSCLFLVSFFHLVKKKKKRKNAFILAYFNIYLLIIRAIRCCNKFI